MTMFCINFETKVFSREKSGGKIVGFFELFQTGLFSSLEFTFDLYLQQDRAHRVDKVERYSVRQVDFRLLPFLCDCWPNIFVLFPRVSHMSHQFSILRNNISRSKKRDLEKGKKIVHKEV